MKLTPVPLAVVICLAGGLAGPGFAQTRMDHSAMNQSASMNAQGPTETGQSAFAAIAEIVILLQADPNTDWTTVNIAALRAHLVDMDAVTLRSDVVANDIEAGAAFTVTSPDANVTGSIRRMLLAHGRTMSGFDGMVMASVEIADGARMTVTGPDSAKIRGLGFFGVMTLGVHHQAHHMALADGTSPQLD